MKCIFKKRTNNLMHLKRCRIEKDTLVDHSTSSLSVLMVLPGGSSVAGVFGALGAGPLLLVMANAALW